MEALFAKCKTSAEVTKLMFRLSGSGKYSNEDIMRYSKKRFAELQGIDISEELKPVKITIDNTSSNDVRKPTTDRVTFYCMPDKVNGIGVGLNGTFVLGALK